jgi:hypothetical protein
MKTIRSKLWSVVSGNQTVSGAGGGGRDQNQSIPDFIRGYNKYLTYKLHYLMMSKIVPFTIYGYISGLKIVSSHNST